MNDNKGVAILVMDTSGSMTITKKAKGLDYFNNLVDESVVETEKRYIGYTLIPTEYDSGCKLIKSDDSGGTYVSSGLWLASDILIDKPVKEIRKSKVVIVTDGDNWCEDNEVAVKLIRDLLTIGVEVHFVEIKASRYTSTLLFKVKDELADFISRGSLIVAKPVIKLN